MLCLFSNLKGFYLITFNSPIFFRSIRLEAKYSDISEVFGLSEVFGHSEVFGLFRFFSDFFGLFRFLDLLISHGSEVFAIFFRFFSEVFGHRFFFQSEVFANTSRSDHRSLNPIHIPESLFANCSKIAFFWPQKPYFLNILEGFYGQKKALFDQKCLIKKSLLLTIKAFQNIWKIRLLWSKEGTFWQNTQ